MKKNILVTGCHRSGSTWTGHVIAKAKNIRYVKEPFNIGNKRNNAPFYYWFEHLNDASEIHQQKTRYYLNSFNDNKGSIKAENTSSKVRFSCSHILTSDASKRGESSFM